jgi:prolipoprotein diacylglyceryltransferase
MNPIIIINSENGGEFYAFTYFAAFLIGFIILVMEGKKRKFQSVSWLLVIVTCFLFFIIGTQIIRFSTEDWKQVFEFKTLKHTVGRSVLGGILLAVPAILISKYILKFHNSVLD